MSLSITTTIMSGMSFLGFLLSVGLIIAMVKNVSLSQWMKAALFGVLIMLSAGLFSLAFTLLARRSSGAGPIFQLLLLTDVFYTVGLGFFVVGISGTLFDVRNQLRIAHAMLNKPAVDDLS